MKLCNSSALAVTAAIWGKSSSAVTSRHATAINLTNKEFQK